MTAMPRRGVRVDDETWQAAMRRAELEHRTVSQVVQIALRAYVDGRYDAIEVRRTGRARR
jgi:Arc/MetJ family transcription regulator